MQRGLDRRRLLIGGIAAAATAVVAACTRRNTDRAAATASPTAPSSPTRSPSGTLEPTPACEPQGAFTPAQTEGPFFRPTSPAKRDLFADVERGTRLVLIGSVLSTDCTPVARAMLDFWQADDEGNYDNAGYRLRGHQFTDSSGRYRLTTIVPGLYIGRTKHIHVKVQPPTGALLTTQLYMPDETQNESDSIFRPELVMKTREAKDGTLNATFTFVVVTA